MQVVFDSENDVVEVDFLYRYISSAFFKACHGGYISEQDAQAFHVVLRAAYEALPCGCVHVGV